MAQKIQIRNGSSGSWAATNPILSIAEPGIEGDTGRFKIGDGVTNWNLLPYTDVAGITQTQPFRCFGDGSDGNVIISSGTTVLNRDYYYNNLTVSGSGKIETNGFKIFVKNILDLSTAGKDAINNNGSHGGDASATTGGITPTVHASGSVASPGQGTNGANGTTGTGVTSAAPSTVIGNGGPSNTSGAGGAGVNAGVGGSGGVSPLSNDINTYITNLFRGTTLLGGGSGGRSGNSGGGDGVNSGGGGGGGGNGGGVVAIYANKFVTSASTSSLCISARGGNGGNGGTPLTGICGGGGSGAGGGGGWIYFIYNFKFGPVIKNLFDVSGGAGGKGGNGIGIIPSSGLPAQGGGGANGGFGGRIFIFQVPFQTGKSYFPPSSSAFVPQVLNSTAAQITGIGAEGGIPGINFADL